MSNQFKAGDVVRLNSGGPIMTIQEVEGDQVFCVWFDKTKQMHGRFPAVTIKLYTPPRPMRVSF